MVAMGTGAVLESIKLSTKNLDQFVKALKGKMPVARVGILQNTTSRTATQTQNKSGKFESKGNQTNAEIGIAHEFGTEKLPIRSFLRVPLADNLQTYLEKSGAFNKSTLRTVVKEGSVREWVQKIAITAEAVIADAFDTGGFGKWKPSDMKHKKVHQTLVETQQLRNSITSEVK